VTAPVQGVDFFIYRVTRKAGPSSLPPPLVFN